MIVDIGLVWTVGYLLASEHQEPVVHLVEVSIAC